MKNTAVILLIFTRSRWCNLKRVSERKIKGFAQADGVENFSQSLLGF
jgi:hypothetical protein